MRAMTLPSTTPVPTEPANEPCLEAATPALMVNNQLLRSASTVIFCAFKYVLPRVESLPNNSAVTSLSTRLVAVAIPPDTPFEEAANIQAVAALSV